ncbi:MAG: PhoX family protein, partial [Gammaproteobacteria bacterium]
MRLLDRYVPIVVTDRDDLGSNPTESPYIGEVIEARMGRRQLLKGAAAGATVGLLGAVMPGGSARAAENPSTLTFEEIEHGIDETHHVAKGYSANVLIRWGDKVFADSPDFDVNTINAAAQERLFGYNCDFIAYMPLPVGSTNSDNGLLCVSHEYTSAELMFTGLTEKNKNDKISKDQVEVEIAAHGHSIVEIKKSGGAWQVV